MPILVLVFKCFMLVCAIINALAVFKQVRYHIRANKRMNLGDSSRLVMTIGGFLIVFLYTRYEWLGNLAIPLICLGYYLQYRSHPAAFKAYWNQSAFPVKPAKSKVAR